MKLVFLCAGVGKRMFPITEDKFLLKFLGKTLLEHQIEVAKRAGLSEFIIIGNPANIEKIRRITEGDRVSYAIQKEPLGMADALESARELLLDGPILVVNPNDVFDSSAYTKVIEEYRRGSATSYILAYQVKDHFPGGYLVVNEQNELQYIVEKPKRGEEPGNLVNIVVHLHTQPKKLFEYIKEVGTTDDTYEHALAQMAKEGGKIKAVAYDSFWAAIKYPWHVFAVMEHFLSGRMKAISSSAEVLAKATIEGDVILEDNVKVLENAVIRGPCYIGRNTVIGNNVLIRDRSHIGESCVVGYGTEIKHSYIGDNCWFHSNYIGDSIIADGCSFGAGTITANWRYGEDNIKIRIGGELIDTGMNKLGAIVGTNCKTGINVSLMPGVRIGPNSIVGPHLCLSRDLGPHKKLLKQRR